jgi:hypothetical protein
MVEAELKVEKIAKFCSILWLGLVEKRFFFTLSKYLFHDVPRYQEG